MQQGVTSQDAPRGLAHPLRVRLLRLLQSGGPSTATKLAAISGASSGLTSYHLRQLAAAGLISEVDASGRERWWQANPAAPTPSPRRGESLRAEILDAAGRLLAELGGAQGLSIRAVARAVGIAPASIYHHFADKDALVAGLVDDQYQRMATAMAAAQEAEPAADPIARFAAQLHAYCRFALEHPGHYRLMLSTRPILGTDGQLHGPIVRLVRGLITALERCAQAGHGLRLPTKRAALMAFAACHGRVVLWQTFPDEALAEQIDPFVRELVSLVIT